MVVGVANNFRRRVVSPNVSRPIGCVRIFVDLTVNFPSLVATCTVFTMFRHATEGGNKENLIN